MKSLIPQTQGNTIKFLRQITDSRTARQRPTRWKRQAFLLPGMLQAIKGKHEKGKTKRTHGEIIGGNLWQQRLCPDFGSWWCGNFFCGWLFSFFFFLFLLLNNPLWIRQISQLMQVRMTGVAMNRPPLLSSCSDTNPLYVSNDVSVEWYPETSK